MRNFGIPSNGARSRPIRPAADLAEDKGTVDVQNALTNIAPFIAALVNKPAEEQVEILRAKIANQTMLRDRFPEPIRTFYVNNLRLLRGKLKAAEHAKLIEREGQQAQRTWRLMGYSITATGVAVGVATVALLLSLSRAANRK